MLAVVGVGSLLLRWLNVAMASKLQQIVDIEEQPHYSLLLALLFQSGLAVYSVACHLLICLQDTTNMSWDHKQ